MSRSWRAELENPAGGSDPDVEFRAQLRSAVLSRSILGSERNGRGASSRTSRSLLVGVAAAVVVLVFGLGWAAGRSSQTIQDDAADVDSAETTVPQLGGAPVQPPTGAPSASPSVAPARPSTGCAPEDLRIGSDPGEPFLSFGAGPDGRFYLAVSIDSATIASVCLPATLADEYFASGDGYAVAAPLPGTGGVVIAVVADATQRETLIGLGRAVGGVSEPAPDLVARILIVEPDGLAPSDPLINLVAAAQAGTVAAERVEL